MNRIKSKTAFWIWLWDITKWRCLVGVHPVTPKETNIYVAFGPILYTQVVIEE